MAADLIEKIIQDNKFYSEEVIPFIKNFINELFCSSSNNAL